ncbi:MAG: TetR/AcrR family transcriptional regulator [Nevskia sp.]
MSTTEIAAKQRAPAAGRKASAAPRQRRTQAERSDEMQQRLVEAAAAVLRRKGYAGLRTEEVSRVAKVSRGAQQHHFPTKDSLVLATAAHLLRSGLERGKARAQNATQAAADPIQAIIDDSMEFFLGPDFGVVLDLVLAGSKDRGLRDEIYKHSRENRLGVESAWIDVLCSQGLPRDKAEKILWLTVSIIRGFAVRALWQRDEAWFRALLDEWKLILAGHLNTIKKHPGDKR